MPNKTQSLLLFSDNAHPVSGMEATTSKSRIRFDDRLKRIFADLFENHNNGETKAVLTDLSLGKNFERARAWESFTEDFNAVGSLKYLLYQFLFPQKVCSGSCVLDLGLEVTGRIRINFSKNI
jgi:hypothetical protein